MAYVEFLRVRNALYVFAGIVTALIAFLLISLLASHGGGNDTFRLSLGNAIILTKGPDGRIHQSSLSADPRASIPLSALFGIAGYAATVFATVVSTSLNKERDGLDFPFTRPVPRERMALEYFLVDFGGVLAAFVFSFVIMCLVPLATAGLLGRITPDESSLWMALLGLGIGVMWFGIIQALTAPYRRAGGWTVGVSWAVFLGLLALPGMTYLGPVVHAAAMALNFFNPLAYFTSLVVGHDSAGSQVFDFSLPARVGLVWTIGLAACALAIASWKRVEV